ncbi:MAG: YfiR family protein [Acidobacteria bacterium]|nr:YfiR family protein [Acidobacteriota bacterium]
MPKAAPIRPAGRVALWGAALACALHSQPAGAPETGMRAAFVYQLAQYAEWPLEVDAAKPLRLCVVGDTGLAKALTALVANKRIGGRRVATSNARLEDLQDCHVAFVAIEDGKAIREFFSAWTFPPVLLVGETERFAELGGMVNLVLEDGRVNFEVNLGSTRRAGLTLRSQLLRFARIVKPAGSAK